MLFREVTKTFFVIVIVLLLLILANSFVHLLGKAAAGAISNELMLTLLGLSVLKLLGFVIPPAFFFSVLWVLGGMYRNGEMAALSAAGVPTLRLYRPFLLVALPLVFAVSWLVLFILPEAKAQADHLQREFAANINISGIKPGAFNEFQKGNLVVFAGSGDSGKAQLGQVFIQHRQRNDSGIVVAEKARVHTAEDGNRYIVLQDGYRYQGVEGVTDYSITTFKEYAVLMPGKALPGKKVRLSARPSDQLWRSDDLKERAELQYRIGAPVSILVLLLISVPLAKSAPREGVYGRLVTAVIIYALYMNLQKAAQEWMAEGVTAPLLGTWWLSLVFVLVALAISYLGSMDFAVRRKRMFRSAS